MSKKQAKKSDKTKPMWGLLPVYPLEEASKVMTAVVVSGKYKANDWRKGRPFSIDIDGIHRHLADFETGNDIDKDSGRHALAHIICDAMILLENTITHPELDDRPKGVVRRDGKVAT